jgi:hypothetical protein
MVDILITLRAEPESIRVRGQKKQGFVARSANRNWNWLIARIY